MRARRLTVVENAPPRNAPVLRGFQLAYRAGETNRCPGCGRSHWHVGRVMAECGFCGFAVPIVEQGRRP